MLKTIIDKNISGRKGLIIWQFFVSGSGPAPNVSEQFPEIGAGPLRVKIQQVEQSIVFHKRAMEYLMGALEGISSTVDSC